jgi:hypothetical protein
MYINKKPNSYIRERHTQKKNHRWNNDAYCNIENSRYTNIYIDIYRKRHETVL